LKIILTHKSEGDNKVLLNHYVAPFDSLPSCDDCVPSSHTTQDTLHETHGGVAHFSNSLLGYYHPYSDALLVAYHLKS